jgi:hypothetical protein
MALTGKIDIMEDIPLYNVYCRINRLIINLERKVVDVAIGVYKSKPNCDRYTPPIKTFHHSCSGAEYKFFFSDDVLNQEGKEPTNQAYKWLKTFKPYSEMSEV